MKIWTDYDEQLPPKQVIFEADFGTYTDKCIRDYKNRLWSESEHVFILEKPIKWRI